MEKHPNEAFIVSQLDNSDSAKKLSTLLFEQMQQPWGSQFLPSGYHELDALTHGFVKGELVVVAGRPSVGKTNLLVNLALHMAAHTPALYANFDLPTSELINRFIAASSNMPMAKLADSSFGVQEKDLIIKIDQAFQRLPLYILNSGPFTVKAIDNWCKEHVVEHGVQLIIIDYLQMMSTKKSIGKRQVETAHIGRMLKCMAATYNVCIIVSSQLNRAIETRKVKKHKLSDLGESFSIEQYADKVLFINHHREFENSLNEQNSSPPFIELTIAKNRTGQTGRLKLETKDGHITYKSY